MRWIILHIIEETARHAGHLDTARELLDGRTDLGWPARYRADDDGRDVLPRRRIIMRCLAGMVVCLPAFLNRIESARVADMDGLGKALREKVTVLSREQLCVGTSQTAG